MKRTFMLLFFILQFSFLSSQNWKFSVEPLFGMRYGEIGEYVFLKECDYANDKLSELDWEIKPEFLAGFKTDFGYGGLLFGLEFSFGLPMQTGSMIDSDWFNSELKNAEAHQYKTNLSVSDNNLMHDFSFGITAGYMFDVFKGDAVRIGVKPKLAFDYENFYFNGKNGFAWYGKKVGGFYESCETVESPTYDFSEKDVIDYSRQKYVTWLGFDAEVNLPKNFSLNAGFMVSPYTYAESIDIHYLNNEGNGTAYLDATPGYFQTFKWSVGASYKINSWNSLSISSNWLYMEILRGDNYSKSYEQYKKNNKFNPTKSKSGTVDGGASEHFWNLSLSWRLTIL